MMGPQPAPPMAQPQQPPLFGLIVPGYPCRTDFVPADPTGLKYTLTMSDPPPSTVADLVFFLLSPNLPPNHGAMLYWKASTSDSGFELLGAVSPERPSGVFRTGWGQNSTIINSISPIIITFGISIEPITNIQNLNILQKGVEDRLEVAKKIALNLYNFLKSFDDTGGSSGFMTVPNNVFERWIQRFQNKYRLDPNFFMKDDS